MIQWFKKNKTQRVKKNNTQPEDNTAEFIQASNVPEADFPGPVSSSEALVQEPSQAPSKHSLYDRFKRGLSKTRQQLGGGIGRLLLGQKELDSALFEEIETQLIQADIGVETVHRILKEVTAGLARKDLSNGAMVFEFIKNQLASLLLSSDHSLLAESQRSSPFVILVVGVNGAGKTTTIGKMAKQFQQQGKKVMLAAGDTFRAAAIEQLQTWGERNSIPVIAQQIGADSASVIFDALQSAKARGVDILIADTAGRLHTQHNLMEELKKVKRVIQKLDPNAPQEIMLVLDASIGQNALSQAREFHQAVGLTGITMTKLDGTAKGGILFAIANELRIPFRYIGIGEGIDDLRLFDASQFVEAIFTDD